MNAAKTQKASTKKEAVGPDGLTKKERRALKLQTREPQENSQPAPKPKEAKTIAPEPTETPPTSNTKAPLTEKELRKLDWDKKLAAQKPAEAAGGKEAPTLSKAELKAKRREQQEQQRLAKTVPTTATITAAKAQPEKPISKPAAAPEIKKPEKKAAVVKKAVPVQANKVPLVQHLYNEPASSSTENDDLVVHKDVHPAFVRLGVQYSTHTILGSNARCLALLEALKQLVNDLQTPAKQEFCRYLESVLQTCTNYLQKCRPLAVSMTNALKHFKLQLTQIDTNLSDNQKRDELLNSIEVYVQDEIVKAGKAICMKVNEKISNGDVILTYGCSSLIRKILLEAHKDGKKFEVVVVDGSPHLEGREMLRRLVEDEIKCRYVLIHALSYIMGSVSKILLGAHALLTNGYVMSRIGTAQVALVAQSYNKPVLVCCETYKFSERVQTDSFVYNEIGDEDKLIQVDSMKEASPLVGWKDNNKLTPLNLLYDVTPPHLVTAVVTELAILPCTSVPVVLRINANDNIQ